MKRIVFLIFLVLLIAVQVHSGGPPGKNIGPNTDLEIGSVAIGTTIKLGQYTVATLPSTLGAGDAGMRVEVTDGADTEDCTVGGGTDIVECRWSGSAWANAGDGVAAGSAEVSDATIGGAGDTDTTHAYSKDDIHDYLNQHDTDFDGLPDGVENDVLTIAMLADSEFSANVKAILGAANYAAIGDLLWPDLVAGDIPDLSGTYEVQLNNEAGLYAVLSDVSQFYQPGDTIQTNSGTSLPGTCTVGETFIDTDADTNGSLYICVASDTWKEVDDDGAAGGGDLLSTNNLSDLTNDTTALNNLFAAGYTWGAVALDLSAATVTFGLAATDLPTTGSWNASAMTLTLPSSIDYPADTVNALDVDWGDGANQIGWADIVALFASGSCSGYLKSDGTCDTPAGGGDLLANGTVPLTANWDVGAYTITGTRFISDIATGTAPFGVSSTTVVTNLNADLLDGQEGSYYAPLTSPGFTTAANPVSADGAALGTTALEWSDLFLADAGVIYFGADQDITLTHVADAGLLTNGYVRSVQSWGADITGNISLNTTALHGVIYQVTAACTITLDAAADAGYGAEVGFRVRDASETVIIEIDASDKINLNGTALDAGDTIDSPGAAGDYIILKATTDADGSGTDGWVTFGSKGTWTDGGAT